MAKNHRTGLYSKSRTISNFPMSAILGIGHFAFCRKMLYFTNALRYRYETWYASSAPCCPPFWIMLKTYFFELLLDHQSDFHQIWLRSSSDHAGKNVWISRRYTKRLLFNASTNFLERCQTASEAVSLQSFDIFTPNFVCAIVTSNWPRHINLVTAPPIGQE